MRLYLWLADPVALDTDIHPGDICWYDVSQGEQSLFLPHTQTQAAPTLDSFLIFTHMPPYLWLVDPVSLRHLIGHKYTSVCYLLIWRGSSSHIASYTHTCGSNPWTTWQIFIRFSTCYASISMIGWSHKIDAYHWTTIFTSVISVDMTCHMADRALLPHTCGPNPWTTRQIFIRFTLALGGRLTTNNNKPQTKKNFPFNQKSDIRGAQ